MENTKTTLLEFVKNWVDDKSSDYHGNREAVFNDLLQHGCQSGMVSELIYFEDTLAFYETYKQEINALLYDLLTSCGYSVDEMFTAWDKEDPLAIEQNNKNLLAWFGFEETARILADEEGFEI